MTLTISYFDKNVTIHVADRRLCLPVNGGYEPVTDDAVKVDLVRGSVLTSYAGRSKVLGLDTPRWLETRLEQAGETELQLSFQDIANELTKIFAKPSYENHLLVVSLSGWSLNSEQALVPIVGAITNQHPVSLARLPAFKGVAAEATQVTAGKPGWTATGRITDLGKAELAETLQKLLAKSVHPEAIVNALANQIRVEAGRDKDGTISTNLRSAILPRSVVDWALATNTSSYVLAYDAEANYIYGQPMMVDLPDGKLMEAHKMEDLQIDS